MAAEALLVKKKWEGKATAQLQGVRPEQVWSLFLDDFCSFHKWLPTIDTCRHVEGVAGQPGLIRFCSSNKQTDSTPPSSPPASHNGEVKVKVKVETNWCHEKLTAVDPVLRSLSYEVLDNNLGIKSYVSTIKVLPPTNSDDGVAGEAAGCTDNPKGCQIQWSVVADPFEGEWTEDGLLSYINFALQGIAANMEKSLKPCATDQSAVESVPSAEI